MENNNYNKENVVLFSEKYNEHYKSITLGINESFLKFVIPSFDYLKKITQVRNNITNNTEQIYIKKLNILDDCFGYGFNTIATIYYTKLNYPNTKISIFSFEKEKEVVTKIKEIKQDLFFFCEKTKYFEDIFPNVTKNIREKTFRETIEIIENLNFHETKNNNNNFYYHEKNKINIKIFIEDLNNINKKIKFKKFDFIYHDPFSIKNNPDAWSENLFKKIQKTTKKNTIITSYSSNSIFRNILRNLKYKIINIDAQGRRKPSTLALKIKIFDKKLKITDKN
ncbi:MAG: MnmC family methyltransferase [Candidatus Nanoarchaeia archaeon]|nr:MnmC family methyltransferase [Candidatus Nanoarchaeia archaeon]